MRCTLDVVVAVAVVAAAVLGVQVRHNNKQVERANHPLNLFRINLASNGETISHAS